MSNNPNPLGGNWPNNATEADHQLQSNELEYSTEDGSIVTSIYPNDIQFPTADRITHQISKRKTEFKLKQRGVESKNENMDELMQIDPPTTLGFTKYCPKNIEPRPDFESNVLKATQYLLQTYVNCNSEYSFPEINNPRRPLTKNTEPSTTCPTDNKEGDYILYVNEIIGLKEGHQYLKLIGIK